MALVWGPEDTVGVGSQRRPGLFSAILPDNSNCFSTLNPQTPPSVADPVWRFSSPALPPVSCPDVFPLPPTSPNYFSPCSGAESAKCKHPANESKNKNQTELNFRRKAKQHCFPSIPQCTPSYLSTSREAAFRSVWTFLGGWGASWLLTGHKWSSQKGQSLRLLLLPIWSSLEWTLLSGCEAHTEVTQLCRLLSREEGMPPDAPPSHQTRPRKPGHRS